ncbi:MAG: Ig-like domain-containing protein [Fibrobacter sp.]|nr:Ig-like domain-containing protein [Fibrobacter sp.]
MRLKYAFSLVTAAALLAACDSTVTNTNDDAKAEGNITIMVVDNHSGAALSGATVYSVTDDKAVVGDSLGRSVWKKRALGDHSFQVSKDGYATVHTQVTLAEQGQGDVPRVGDVVQTVPMYKAGVLAKGIVLYNDDKGKLNAASKVTVYANLPPEFVPSELSTQTNDKGEYSFDNLPEGVEIAISVGQELIDSKKYVGDAVHPIGGASYRSGDLINVGAINLVKTAAQIVKVADNTSEIDTVSDVTFTFAAELEADSVNVSKWTVTKGGNDVLVTVALSSDKRTVSVTPYTEKWTKGSTYSVRGTVYSVDGSSSTVSASFTVGGGSTGSSARPGNVDGLKITEDEDYSYYIHLSWNEAKGDVYRYNIYLKTNLVNDFAFYTSTADTTYRIDLDDFSSSVTDVYYIVLPVNDDGVEADIAGARSVKYTIE